MISFTNGFLFPEMCIFHEDIFPFYNLKGHDDVNPDDIFTDFVLPYPVSDFGVDMPHLHNTFSNN